MSKLSICHNRIAVITGPRTMELVDTRLPSSPPDDYVRLRVHYCAICGSDIAFYTGQRGSVYPRSVGHEYCGTIESVGKHVRDLRIGEYAAIDPNYRCGDCVNCAAERSHLCVHSDLNLFSNRGLAHYADVHCSYVHPVPCARDHHLWALAEPLSCALHATDLANVTDDDRILIIGCGGIGSLLSFVVASLSLREPVSVYDAVSDRMAGIGRALPGRVQAIRQSEIAGGQRAYSVVFEVSGDPAGLLIAMTSVERAGRIVVVSRYDERAAIGFHSSTIARKEGSIVFAHRNGHGEAFQRALALIASRQLEVMLSLLTVRSFWQTPEVFAEYQTRTANKMIIDIR